MTPAEQRDEIVRSLTRWLDQMRVQTDLREAQRLRDWIFGACQAAVVTRVLDYTEAGDWEDRAREIVHAFIERMAA